MVSRLHVGVLHPRHQHVWGRATPLILLDGVEISSADLNSLPPETIESFSILKDASATAIYGARGANGVMLVTTKVGAENTRARINVTYEHSFLHPVNVVEYADGVTYMKTYNEALLSRNPTATPKYTDLQIENTRKGLNPYVYPDVDWYDLMLKKWTQSQRANVNIQGGGSRVTYYMSLQANHDEGALKVPKTYSMDNNHSLWRYVFQNNIEYKVTSTTKLGLRMNAQIMHQTSPNTSAGKSSGKSTTTTLSPFRLPTPMMAAATSTLAAMPCRPANTSPTRMRTC